ncbi:Aste57867_2492 [Aphanomyces stellatus]|uniref:Aste57867_2492 protein n=1 Tax=Aphanomyces stellatus TaxID=120398 RepID=A0A485K8T3_9STRA|nr:hypothetical protein As57867_002485 [Aphanomyces stellatus]VFT79691.1 Aste57867_2492 [Aphanomyces stellatus]
MILAPLQSRAMINILVHGRRLVTCFALLATAQAQKSVNCLYDDLPREVTAVRVWDDALCSPETLRSFDMCVVDKTTCAQLPTNSAYQAVGDISKSKKSALAITSKVSLANIDFSNGVFPNVTTMNSLNLNISTMDLSKVIFPSTIKSLSFSDIANFSLPSTFQWPNLLSLSFYSLSNATISIAWPSTLSYLTFIKISNSTLSPTFPTTLASLTFKSMSNVTLPPTFPSKLTVLQVQDVDLQTWPNKLPESLKTLIVKNCANFPGLDANEFSATLNSLTFDNTSITELVLNGLVDLSRTLKNNRNMTRLDLHQVKNSLSDVFVLMENMNIKSLTMDAEIFTKIQKASLFYNTTMTVDSSECIRNNGAIRQFFDKNTPGNGNTSSVLTVCVRSQGDSVPPIAGIVPAGVVIFGLGCYLLYAHRKRMMTLTARTPPILPPQCDCGGTLEPCDVKYTTDQEYTHKTALWSDNSLEPNPQITLPSAPRQSLNFSVHESTNGQPFAPVLSPLAEVNTCSNLTTWKMKTNKDDNLYIQASVAPKLEPSIAPTPTASKSPFEIEENTHCIVCLDGPQDAACIPCGHNAICMTCAQVLIKQAERSCSVCRQEIREVIRIFRG